MGKSPTIAILTLCSALAGCDPEGTGDVAVRWTVGVLGSCRQAGLETVSIALDAGGAAVAVEERPCTAGEVVFWGVPLGSYRAVVVAIDGQGVPAYEGSTTVEASPGAAAGAHLVRLAPRPGEVEVAWHFSGGRLCSYYGVEEIVVRMFRDDAGVRDRSAACNAGRLRIGRVEPGTIDVLVEGRDDRGRTSHSFLSAKLRLPPGHTVAIEAPLEPCHGLFL